MQELKCYNSRIIGFRKEHIMIAQGQKKIVGLLLMVAMLLCVLSAQSPVYSLNCSIPNQTYTVDYMLPSMFIPIESANFFKLQYQYSSTNVTMMANISSPVLNCSNSYTSTEFLHYDTSRTKVTGTSCFIMAPIVSNLNITITGSVAMNFTQSASYRYEGHYDCFGYIFINVTMPKPQPQPQPQPQPSPSTESETKVAAIVGIINLSLLFVIGLIGLLLYCVRGNRRNTPLVEEYRQGNYKRQQV